MGSPFGSAGLSVTMPRDNGLYSDAAEPPLPPTDHIVIADEELLNWPARAARCASKPRTNASDAPYKGGWYEAGSCAKSWATSSAAAACDSSWERVKYKIAVAVEAAIDPILLVKYSSKTVAL